MPEERKPAPLPPEPWRIECAGHYNGWIVADAKDQALAVCWHSGCGDATEAVADLFRRAPALEAELKQAFEDHQEVCAVVINLRTRLESVEAVRRDAQEGRFALIIENEELGADLVATRARLESVEAALKEARGLIGDLYDNGCWNDAQVAEIRATCARLDAALGGCPLGAPSGHGERSEG